MWPEPHDLWDAFVASLETVGLESELDPGDGTGTIEGIPVVLKVKPVPSAADVLAFRRLRSPGAYKVMVARRVSAEVRGLLDEADIGYFDGRGHLRIWRRPVLIDADVPRVEAMPVGHQDPNLAVPSLIDVAIGALDGLILDGVRVAASVIGRSPGTVSKQLATLRRAHLVDDRGAPTVPDLFQAVLEEWHPTRLPLADLPRPGAGRTNERLKLGLDDVRQPGWVLADTAAATAWGAPVVVAANAPPDFYVPDRAVLLQARALLGEAEFGRHGCTVAVAPAPIVCRHRYERSEVFPAPSAVVAALDLAGDPARGREILDLWSRNLSSEIRRVW